MTMIRKFSLGSVLSDSTLGPRQIRVVASDATPDRVKDVMVAGGCRVESYRKNPIVLADHDRTSPIGTAEIEIKGGRVEALVTFAPEGISTKADEYCGLAKAGVLNAVSVGFAPINAEQIKGGGTRFTEWDLMELSLVAVPANPSAVVIGRAASDAPGGWKCSASRTLPLVDCPEWDPEAAADRIFAEAGFDTERPNTKWAAKAFLFHDPAAPKSKAAYGWPIADVIDGRLLAIKQSIDRMATLPEVETDPAAQAVLSAYSEKVAPMGREKESLAVKAFEPKIKSLYDVAYLGEVLACLGWAYDQEQFCEALEGEPSSVLPMLGEALRVLADAFLALTEEEIAELLASRGGDGSAAGSIFMAARGAVEKSGRKISGKNAACLDEALKCVESAAGHIKTVRAEADMQDEGGDDMAEKMAAHRSRLVSIAKLAACP